MSDEVTGQPEGSYPPPPGGIAPPPPPPPGLFPEAAAPAGPVPASPPETGPVIPEPRAKKRTGLIVGIVVAVLLCGLAACIGAVVGFGLLGGADTESIGQAETHYSAAMGAVERANTSMEALESLEAGSAEVETALAEASKELRTGRDEIAAARVAIEQLDESQGKSDYLASLDEATKALDGLEDLLAYMGTASGMIKVIDDAGTSAQRASDNLNDAISSGNSRKYAAMKTKAKSASSGFAKAAVLFGQAHKLDESAGLDKAADYVRKRKAQADVVVIMAGDGKAGRVSAYNKGIKKMNKLGAEAEKIGEPAIVSDPDWVEKRLGELNDAITAAAERADELRVKALEGLNYTG